MAERKRRNTKKQPPAKKVDFRGLLITIKKVIVGICLLGFVGVVGFYGAQEVDAFLSKPFEQVFINGEFEHTSDQELRHIIVNSASKSFVKEHLENIREELVELPWVDNATLTRRWPNQLEVSIVEQKAIARWGDKGFVNFKGQLIKTTNLGKVQHLPQLYGTESDAATIMREYKKLTSLLMNNQLAIRSLSKDSLGIWQMQLSNDWTLILGRYGLEEKIQTVNQVLEEEILLVDDAVDTIDMRYENGFAIAWQQSVSIVSENDNDNQAKTGEPS